MGIRPVLMLIEKKQSRLACVMRVCSKQRFRACWSHCSLTVSEALLVTTYLHRARSEKILTVRMGCFQKNGIRRLDSVQTGKLADVGHHKCS